MNDKSEPRKVLEHLKVLMKEKRKDLGKRTGQMFRLLNIKTTIELGFRQNMKPSGFINLAQPHSIIVKYLYT